MTHTFLYTRDSDTEKTSVIYIGNIAAQIWHSRINRYEKQFYAQKYLKGIMEETIPMNEPDEIIRKKPGETEEEFANRVAGDLEHIAEYTRVYPNYPAKALDTPKVFYKSLNIFPPSDIWYETEKEAKKESDGIDTIYVGPVEVYDPAVIEQIETEISSYEG